jgi:hypothetical protein
MFRLAQIESKVFPTDLVGSGLFFPPQFAAIQLSSIYSFYRDNSDEELSQ